MKRFLGVLLIVTTLLGPCVAWVHAEPPPFVDIPQRLTTADGKPYSPEHVVRIFQVAINSLPLLLSRYLDSGDLLVSQRIRETLRSMPTYVNAIGKSAHDNERKEVFAKLTVSSQKLRESVERNLSAVEEFRRVQTAFSRRAPLILDWLDRESDRLLQIPAGSEQDLKFVTALLVLRSDLLKSIFVSRVTPCGTVAETQTTKRIELWERAVRQAELLAAIAATTEEKQLTFTVESSVKKVRELGRRMLVQADELGQSWDQTLALVESVSNLVSPLTGDTVGPASSPFPSKERGEPQAQPPAPKD